MLILASSSPRRKQLLSRFTTNFKVIKPKLKETIITGETPLNTVERLSYEKATAVAKLSTIDDVIIGADTIVILNAVVYGKPTSVEHAKEILRTLSGKTHIVMTSITIISNSLNLSKTFTTSSYVKFNNFGEDIINYYISTGEYIDKAGSYGIQGIGSILVHSIKGDYDNIVGLPIAKLVYALKDFDIDLTKPI